MHFLFKQELQSKSRFLFFLFSLLLFILPIILSNTLYFDDNSRVLTGKAYWDVDGRPLTDIIFYLLNSNVGTVSNIQPLPLLTGVCVLAISLWYSTENVSYKKTPLNLFPFLLLVCNPFFLQNLSYQFDSVGMCLAMSCGLLAFFYKPDNSKKYTYLYPVFFLCLSNCFYQPVSNVFLTLYFTNILIRFRDFSSVVKETFYNAGIYISGMAMYSLLAFTIFPVTPGRSDFIHISQLKASFEVSLSKLVEILYGFTQDYFLIIGVLAIVLIIINYIVAMIVNVKRESQHLHKAIAGLITLITPFGLVLSLWGPFLLIDELFFNPREFPSLGVFLMLACFSLKRIDERGYIFSLFTAFFIVYVFSFSFIYGNTLKNQRDYENRIYTDITNHINSDPKLAEISKIEIYGETGLAPKAINAYNTHPYLYILAQPSYRWVQRYIIKAQGLENVSTNVAFDDSKEWNRICSQHLTPSIWNKHYEIYLFDSHASVWIKKTKQQSVCNEKPEKYYNQFSKELN